ncbi:MAG: M1 family aminopeptidase [Chloroflexota bacterium]|nr:M1 family aminopeptidase [Chloroflexota bacterium]
MIRLSLLFLFILAACALTATEPTSVPTATPTRALQTTLIPTAERRFQIVSTQVIEEESQDCVVTTAQLAQYVVQADIDYAARTAEVTQSIRYPNVGTAALNDIILDVEPNRVAGAFVLDAVRLDGQIAEPVLDARRLTVPLAEPLAPGCEVRIDLRFSLRVPAVAEGRAGFTGYFGYTSRQLNLGHWLPVVAYRANDEWVTHDVLAIGEQTVTELADWQVNMRLLNAPEDVEIAAPGTTSRPTTDTYRFEQRARDVAVSISDQFAKRIATGENGVTVELYTLGDPQPEAAAHALDAAVRSQAMYSDLFGAYPNERLVIVEGDFPDGMEFSGLMFVGTNWFINWTGSAQSYLTIITVHEVSHQWWYARVGSDQATTPWLDEALATYSEFIFYEEYYPDLRDWWWQFRVYSFVPLGFADIEPVSSSVYRFENVRQYINAVYLRGAVMLGQLRNDLGTDDFFAWLAAYAQAGDGQVVTPNTLWALLTPEQLAATEATRAQYLAAP